MRELEERETTIKSVQDKAECLLLESHPARLTIEVKTCCPECSTAFEKLCLVVIFTSKFCFYNK